MQKEHYIYCIKVNTHEKELCKLESKILFNDEVTKNLHFSNFKINPDSSAFIKKRIDIMYATSNFEELLILIKTKDIHAEGFKLEYEKLEGDAIGYHERLSLLRDIGYIITGEPDYYQPTVTYALCNYEGVWYFGESHRDTAEWQKHNHKPCSFSNSLSMNLAKTLVNIASEGKKENKLIDACCGVGTVMLEACYAGFNIEGNDINWKAYNHTQKNLEHYGYKATIHNEDIKDIIHKYDAAIIDLPYNLYSQSSDEIAENIISSASKIALRLVIVSITDIQDFIKKAGLKVIDSCTVDKTGKVKFTRFVWVCEKTKH